MTKNQGYKIPINLALCRPTKHPIKIYKDKVNNTTYNARHEKIKKHK